MKPKGTLKFDYNHLILTIALILLLIIVTVNQL